MGVSFKSKPIKIGNSFYAPIPKAYVDNGLISTEKEYRFVAEAENEDNS